MMTPIERCDVFWEEVQEYHLERNRVREGALKVMPGVLILKQKEMNISV